VRLLALERQSPDAQRVVSHQRCSVSWCVGVDHCRLNRPRRTDAVDMVRDGSKENCEMRLFKLRQRMGYV
jgi:hypothetical protein